MTRLGAPSEERFLALLKKEFRKPTYAILKQVPIPVLRSDGWHEQHVDAVVVGAWESRGTAILGFEIKASRASWLSELKDPPKAEGAAVFCDAWYILADQNVVQVEELPENWGLYVVRKGCLSLEKAAPKVQPKELGREALFSILKEFMVQANSTSIKTSLKRQYDLGYQAGKSEAGRLFTEVLKGLKDSQEPDELQRLRHFVMTGPHGLRFSRIELMEKLFESFTKWDELYPTEKAIKAVEFFSANGLLGIAKKLSSIQEDLQGLLESTNENLKNIQELATISKPSPKLDGVSDP